MSASVDTRPQGGDAFCGSIHEWRGAGTADAQVQAARSIDPHEQLIRLIRKEMWQARIQWAVCFGAAAFIGFSVAVQL